MAEKTQRQEEAAAFAELQVLRKQHLYKAITAAEESAKMWPESVPIHVVLAELRAEIGAYELAQQSYATALKIMPNHALVLMSLGQMLSKIGKLDAAKKTLSIAILRNAKHTNAHLALAEVFILQNKIEDARKVLTACLKFDPTNGSAHRRLAMTKKYVQHDEHINTLETLLAKSKSKNENLANLHYAYAKAMADLGDVEKSFLHYSKGAEIKKNESGYTVEKDSDLFSLIKASMIALRDIVAKPNHDFAPHTPIFIVGMPRSCTTLIEQIISQHSSVTAAGELSHINRLANNMIIHVDDFDAEQLLGLRNIYLSCIKNIGKNTQNVIDKMPHNFRYVSLIRKCFPEAKIVHISRDPRATCWSNFTHFFPASGLAYSWDVNDTVAYYNMYLDLMDFHREHMDGEMIEVQYENLVANPEVEIRKLIAALGLEWQDACLEPQKNKRAVRTASQMQVRKGIYKGSSDSWRKFEPFLVEAFSKLKGVPTD